MRFWGTSPAPLARRSGSQGFDFLSFSRRLKKYSHNSYKILYTQIIA
uniref:Uncharacterized protein n=1 Tax=Anguilla anguilla TaxID=7936 RepID=A0A0E9T6A8_ANGAN